MKLPKFNLIPRIPLPGNRVLTGHAAQDTSDEDRSRLRRVAHHLPSLKVRPRRKDDRVFGICAPPPDARSSTGGGAGRPVSAGRPLSGPSPLTHLPVELHREILRPLLLGPEVRFQGRKVYMHNARARPGTLDSQARQTGAQTVLNATHASRAWHVKSDWDVLPLARMLSQLDRISFDNLDQPEEKHTELGKHSLSKALRRGLGLSSDGSVPELDPVVLDAGERQLFDMSFPVFGEARANVSVGGVRRSREDPPAEPGEPLAILAGIDPTFFFLVEGPRGAQALGLHALIQQLLAEWGRDIESPGARDLLIDAIKNLPSQRERLTCLLHLHLAIRYPDQAKSRDAYRQEALEAARHLEHRNVQDTLDVLLPLASSGQYDAPERPVVIEILLAYIGALKTASGQQASGSAASRPTGGDIGRGGWPTEVALDQIEAMLALEAERHEAMPGLAPVSESLRDEWERLSRWVSEQRSGAPAPAQGNVPE